MKVGNLKKIVSTVVVLLLMSACASKPPVVEVEPESDIKLTYENWSSVIPEENISIVLFDPAGTSWLKTRYEELKSIGTNISYFKYTFSDKAKDEKLAKKTPSIHLYKEGFLIDIISGKPQNYQEAVDFDRDVRLWMDTTVNSLRFNSITGVTYKFNGSYNIDIRVFQ